MVLSTSIDFAVVERVFGGNCTLVNVEFVARDVVSKANVFCRCRGDKSNNIPP